MKIKCIPLKSKKEKGLNVMNAIESHIATRSMVELEVNKKISLVQLYIKSRLKWDSFINQA